MNTYRTTFVRRCPVNGLAITYRLEIRAQRMLRVEAISRACGSARSAPVFHEALADRLHAQFGGAQTLTAEHHGVTIESHRP